MKEINILFCVFYFEDKERKSEETVIISSEDDLERYSIYDVVLPLPGFDVKYPENVVKDWYKEALEEYGLELEMHKQKVKLVLCFLLK